MMAWYRSLWHSKNLARSLRNQILIRSDKMLSGNRCIHNVFLLGLYESAFTDSLSPKNSAIPEAFFDNPEETFRKFMLDDDDLTDADAHLPGTQKELRTLSRLLRLERAQLESLAFIKENTGLLFNTDIRNFFDALFFQESLYDTLIRRCKRSPVEAPVEAKLFPNTIESEINKLNQEIGSRLSRNKIADPDLLGARIDLMIYYHEMLIRLKTNYKSYGIDIHDFPNSEASLEEIIAICKKMPELNATCGYAYRVLLRAQLEKAPIEREWLGKILNSYVDIKTSYVDPNNVEPAFEEQMGLHWDLIADQLKNEDSNTLSPLLNRLCNKNGVSTGSEWASLGDLVFQNDQVEVDLKTLTVSLKQSTSGFVKLPHEMITNPLISNNLLQMDLRTVTALKEDVDGSAVYSFKDSNGIPIQIEDKDGTYSLYKKIHINDMDTWLLAYDLTPQIDQNPSDENPSLFSMYSQFKEASVQEKIEKGSIYLFNNLYIDPSDRHKGFILSPSGKVSFQVKVHQSANNLTIDKVWDHRDLPSSGPWEVHNANLLENHSLDFLKGIENKDHIVLWARKGKLKKVELPRYGLKFELEGGRLLCKTQGLEGYYVNPEKNDFNLSHGLILEHPSKGKKLLLGDANALESKTKKLSSKGSGIAFTLHQIGTAWDLLQGKHPKEVTREVSAMKNSKDQLHFTVFDLRPHTGEICQTKNWPFDLLQLIKHEIIAGHPVKAAPLLEAYPLKDVLTNQKLLGALISFCNSDSNTGAEAAIKLKLSLKLLNTLSANNKLKPNIKAALFDASIKNGKLVLNAGRRVPGELVPTDNEKIKLLSLIQKKDPAYVIQMAPHFLETNTSFDPLTLDTAFIDDKIKNWKSDHKPVLIEKRIKTLEAVINPELPLTTDELSLKINRLDTPEPLLFTPGQVQKYFTTGKVLLRPINLVRSDSEKPYETIALDTFQADLNSYKDTESLRDHHVLSRGTRRLQKLIDNKLLPKQEQYEKEVADLKEKIEKSLRKETDPSKQAALIANVKRTATFEEVRLALIQGKLTDLQNQGLIPDHSDLDVLKEQLIDYFDALAKRNAAVASIALVEKMKGIGRQDTKNWNLMSKDLHRLLTLERKYDPKANPKLLVFEAQLGLNLKELEGGLNQLDLLESLLSDPNTLVQAPTGAGKTAVLSVLESLLKSNGNNLVIQKVLPPLYNQTKDKSEAVIGDLFQTLVMPLRFNLKIRLAKDEITYELNDKGAKEETIKQVSIFKGMYEELLEVINNQGCVLTDYTSLPMMEAKFLQIGQELVECSINRSEPTALQLEHYTYLRKILVLLRNKGLASMDEFDQPNRPIQKIQLDLQIGSEEISSDLYIDTTLEIYEILGSDPLLNLDKNIQSDISKAAKEQAIQDSAKVMAKRLATEAGREDLENGITDYLLGLNADVLGHLNEVDPAILDKIAFSMKQFTQFIPLCLSAKEGSNYARSLDGSKTVPAQNGQIHDSKHGTIYEQINYTVQSYRQKGIQAYDLNTWFKEFKADFNKSEGAQKIALEKEFQDLFPNYDVAHVSNMLKSEQGTQTLLAEVNPDMSKVTKFLTSRLQLLKSSGYLISMDPINAGDMTFASSGISATAGAPDSFPEQFKLDPNAIGQIKASMAYRMQARAFNPNEVHSYDPAHPELVLADLKKPAAAIIDGSGAFNNSTQEAAKTLLKSNSDLKQVGYHQDETIAYEGVSTGSLAETGFVFNQAHTRGTDIPLALDAHALLTVNEKEGFRGFAQEEGRLRGEGQTFELAMPIDQKMDNLIAFITNAECVDALQDAKDIYRHATQEIRAKLRNQMLGQLLACEEPEDFVTLFRNEDCNALFITKPEKTYTKSGDYFAGNHIIQKENIKPEDALDDLFAKNKDIADKLGLQLEQKNYSNLIAKMPTAVSGISSETECELQVEVEQEVEAEVEAELELEQNQELDLGNDDHASAASGITYPQRIQAFNRPKAPITNINPAYSPKILVTENFIPYERNKTDSKFKREPFQRSMFNVGTVHINVANQGITNAIIEDPVFDAFIKHETKGFTYDLRLGKVIQDNYFAYSFTNGGSVRNVNTNLDDFIQTPEFHNIIAQIKFLDGRTSGYSEGELAALKQWLIDSGPKAMKKHLLDEVLMYRYREKSQFNSSQLGELFRDIL